MANQSPTKTPPTSFAIFLHEHGFLNETRFEKLQQKLGAKYGKGEPSTQQITDLLLDQKILDEEDVAKARAAFLNLPYIDLRTVTIAPNVLSLIPEESRTFYKMVPFELVGNSLKVALEDASNLQALEALEFLGQKSNYQIHIYLASQSSIGLSLKGAKNLSMVVDEALK